MHFIEQFFVCIVEVFARAVLHGLSEFNCGMLSRCSSPSCLCVYVSRRSSHVQRRR
jgi:hypothetical protein